MTSFIQSIRDHVRKSLLEYIAESEGTTSECESRAGMILTEESQCERDDFDSEYRADGGCTCLLSPPCGWCTHPGNPRNQEEIDECWMPVLKGGAA